jgi:excisionase family DNA binding protein
LEQGSTLTLFKEIQMADLPDYLTTSDVATVLRTSPETVRYWRHESKGPKSFKVGRRVLYAREDVEAWIAAAREDVKA